MEKQTTKQKTENVMKYLKAISCLVNVGSVVNGDGVKATDKDILDAISYLHFQLLGELGVDPDTTLKQALKDPAIKLLNIEAFAAVSAFKQVKNIFEWGED